MLAIQALVSGLSLAAICSVGAANPTWPQFRGPNSDGVADDAQLPTEWATNKNVAWATDIRGSGWSSPIVSGDRVYLTSVVSDGQTEPPKKGLYFGGERPAAKDTHHWMVWCLDAETGAVRWSHAVKEAAPTTPRHLKNTYASETPVTDGERVYAYFGNSGLYCLDRDGKQVWSREWPQVKIANGWGTAASPVIHGDRLYIVNDNDEKSFVVAVDKRTGKDVWQVDRDERSNWATPYVWTNDKRTELVVPGKNRVRSYDLDGHVLWEFGGMSSIVIPTPFSHRGLLYVSSGYVGDRNRPIFVIRPGASGDITLKPEETSNEFIAWCQRAGGPYNPSPLAYGDYLYVLLDFGFLSCYEAATGKEVYSKQRINPEGTPAFTASPWASGNHVYCLSEDGDTFVFQAGPEFKLLGKNSLGEMCMATPALVGDSLYIRTATRLYRLRKT